MYDLPKCEFPFENYFLIKGVFVMLLTQNDIKINFEQFKESPALFLRKSHFK